MVISNLGLVLKMNGVSIVVGHYFAKERSVDPDPDVSVAVDDRLG